MNVEVIMLPVSAGDATILIWSDDRNRHVVLVDAGQHKHEAISYLQSIGIFHLDLIILSHPDLDHIGGLLAIMDSHAMSVDKIWCFDLNFLREFIRTGTIPSPQPATREVVYDYFLRLTLDQFSDILKLANGRGVQVLQVTEGYRLSLGGMLLEVLYPPQSFYDALRSPIALKQLLVNRKWPKEWSDQREGEGEPRSKAHPFSLRDQQARLTKKVKKPDMPKGGFPLSNMEDAKKGLSESELEGEKIPWRMVGTLYNNMSIVVKVSILGGINSPSILFPGDLSDWTTLVLRQWHNLRAEILKVPHHGSDRISLDVYAFHNALEHCIHWHYHFCKRHCLGCMPCEPWFHTEWRQLHDLLDTHDFINLLRELVKPSHILVFPHPQYGLPNAQLSGFASNVIANRADLDLRALSRSENKRRPARVLIGLERNDIKEVR